jgi:hypothetical protein
MNSKNANTTTITVGADLDDTQALMLFATFCKGIGTSHIWALKERIGKTAQGAEVYPAEKKAMSDEEILALVKQCRPEQSEFFIDCESDGTNGIVLRHDTSLAGNVSICSAARDENGKIRVSITASAKEIDARCRGIESHFGPIYWGKDSTELLDLQTAIASFTGKEVEDEQ